MLVDQVIEKRKAAKQEDKPKRKRQTVWVDPDLDRWIRHRIADTGEEISDVFNLAVRKLMEAD